MRKQYSFIRRRRSFLQKGLLCLGFFAFFQVSAYAELPTENNLEVEANTQQAQRTRIRGKVVDDKGEGLIGVTVQVKGTNIATQTDVDGNYDISVPADARTLEFRYAGMETQEANIGGRTTINVTLRTTETELRAVEVISTGYQKIDRSMFTGAATVVKAEDAKVDGVADVSRMLQGQQGVQLTNVSGTFGAAPKLRVRGASSIYGNSNPLWVVDGVVLDDVVDISADDLSSGNAATLISSAVAGLNADDIETFQILKDASATALYGARAMNGVIVITTKKGRRNMTSINYTGEFTMRMKPSYSQYDILDSRDQMSVFLEMKDRGLLQPSTQFLAKNGGVFNKMYTLMDAYTKSSGQFGLAQADEYEYLKAAELRNTDWFNTLFRNTLQQSHSVSVALGTEKANSYLSMSYFNDPGWTKVDGVNRYTFNANTTYDFTEKISLGISGSASVRNQKAPGTLNRTMDVVSGEYSRDFDINPFSYALNSSRMLSSSEYYRMNYAAFNILNEMDQNYLALNMMDTKLQIDASYKPIKGLDINALGAFRYVNSSREHRIQDQSNMALAYRAAESTSIIESNNFLWQNPDDPDAYPVVVMPDGGFYNTQDNSLLSYYGRVSANYNLVKENYAVNFLAGAESRMADRLSRYTNGYGYLWKSELAVTDYRIIRKLVDAGDDYYGMQQTYDRSLGAFLAGTASYKGTYTLNATIRTEGTNQMGKSEQARWLPTWNISGSWNILNEPFMQQQTLVSALTVRATYGLTAKMSPNVNALAVYNAGTTFRPFQSDRETYYNISNLANEELTWEKMKETNIGLDFSVLQHRISITMDAYTRNSFDLIGILRTSGVGGEYLKYANYADMESHGIEFSLNTINIKTKDFTWLNNFTFSYNTSKITDLKTSSPLYDLVGLSGGVKEGYDQRALFSIPFAGLDKNGFPTFYNQDGEIVHYINFQERTDLDFLKYEGSIDPKYIGGFENSIKYKNVKLDLYFTYQAGNVIRLYPTFSSSYSDLDAMTKDIRNRWTLPGDENYTNIPSIPSSYQVRSNSDLTVAYNAYNFSDVRVAKGDFIRLKDITLTYDFNKSLIERAMLRSLQLRFVASNVWLIYSDKALNGQDPEFTRSGGVAMPMPRQFTLSLRAGF